MDILEKQHEKLVSLQDQYNVKVESLMGSNTLTPIEREQTHVELNIIDCLIKFVEKSETESIDFIKNTYLADGNTSEEKFIESDLECCWCGKHSLESRKNKFRLDPLTKDRFVHTCDDCFTLRAAGNYDGLDSKTWNTIVESA